MLNKFTFIEVRSKMLTMLWLYCPSRNEWITEPFACMCLEGFIHTSEIPVLHIHMTIFCEKHKCPLKLHKYFFTKITLTLWNYRLTCITTGCPKKNALSESSKPTSLSPVACQKTLQADMRLLGACKPCLWAWMILKVRFFGNTLY